LEPGESTVLRIATLLAPDLRDFTFGATLVTDQISRPEWRFSCRMLTYPEARLSSDRLSLGEMAPGQQIDREITLETYSLSPDGPMKPDVDYFGRNVVVFPIDSGRLETLPNGIRQRRTLLQVTTTACDRVGDHREDVVLPFGQEATATLNLPVSWFIRANVEISPRHGAFFGNVCTTDAETSMDVRLEARDQTPFQLLSTVVFDDAISAKGVSEGTQTNHLLRITLDPAKVYGVLCGEITVSTSHPLQQEVKIPVAALGLRPKEDRQ